MNDYETLKEIIDEIDKLMQIDELNTLSSLFVEWRNKAELF